LKAPITISIVTPSYNQGHYLEDTIQSVITQSGDFRVDYVVMDGGSTDNSISILRKYEEAIKRGEFKPGCLALDFRWVSERDRGQTHAINKGFHISKGEIVSWINSDDMYCARAFSIVAEYFQRNPETDFLFGDGEVIDETGKLQWEWLSRPYNLKLLKSYHFLWNDFTNYIMQQATFWRRPVFDKIGELDESFHYAMDVEYWIRAGEAGLKMNHIPHKLGKFRMIPGTKSLSNPTVFWPDMLEIFRKYNEVDKMSSFLSYYFFNVFRNKAYNVNINECLFKGPDIFFKWNCFSKSQKDKLEAQIYRGFERACLIAMNRALVEGHKQAALKIFQATIQRKPSLIFSPYALIFKLQFYLGQNLSAKLNRFRDLLIRIYRRRKYQYRYFCKNRGF
jgi:glycosyltransferase involved in cell wall biosynthesis